MIKPRIAHMTLPYLKVSDRYIYELLKAQPEVSNYVFTDRLMNINDFPWVPIILYRGFNNLIQFLRSQRAQIIHAHGGHSGIKAIRVKEYTKLPLLTSLYGNDLTLRPRQDTTYRQQLQNLFHTGEIFTVPSGNLLQRAVELGCPAEKIQIIKCGVDTKELTFVPKLYSGQGNLELITVGPVSERLGIDNIIACLALLQYSDINFRLTIVGNNEWYEYLQPKMDQLGISEQIRLLTDLKRSQIIEEMNQAHLMVLPYHAGSFGDEEAIPREIIEAMAIGLPIVATFTGGIPEILKDRENGRLVAPRSPKALATKIIEYHRRPSIWQPYLSSARERVESEYNLADSANQLMELYQTLGQPKQVL